MSSPRIKFKGSIALGTAVWLLAVGVGIVALGAYSNAVGRSGKAPQRWPADCGLGRMKGQSALVLIAHPRCPCTRATLGELDKLLAQNRHPLQIHVLFVLPLGMAQDWVETDLWRTAMQLPGVEVHRDPGGVKARRFGALTSGQVLLYDRGGRLEFHGGITSSRGHAGDNAGRAAILALLAEEPSAPLLSTPVFGCALFAPATLPDCPSCKP